MYTIPTLTDMRRHLQLAPSDASADDQLLRALQDASHYLESATQRRYCPRLATLDARVDASAPDQLILPDDLLELRAITGSDQGNIALTRARRIPQSADAPASVLRVAETFSDSLRIEGIWGWHDRWTNAWRDSGDALASGIEASAASISVSDVAGADASGESPRFQVGQLLRVNDEYLRVIAVDSADNRMTVMRGVQGTVAGAHASGANIDIYLPPPTIIDMALRYAELLLRPGKLDAQPNPQIERLRRVTL